MKTAVKIKKPLPRSAYERNAEIYKILANSKRLEILNLLREQEMPVEALVKTLGISKANVSQHLALLRHAKLVTVRRHGLNGYYNIIDPRIVEPCRILHKLSLKH
ncbi:MAG TPA: metalloregulator ArsR/SmtB family transcription factor [Candidatus Paceibacterota bacterium]